MPPAEGTVTSFSLEELPAYSGDPYVVIDDNQPDFPEEDRTSTESFETYSPLDALGRCGTAYANIGRDLMPTEDRESISSVTPTGWINRTVRRGVSVQPLPPDRLSADRGERQRGEPHHRHPVHERGWDAAL